MRLRAHAGNTRHPTSSAADRSRDIPPRQGVRRCPDVRGDPGHPAGLPGAVRDDAVGERDLAPAPPLPGPARVHAARDAARRHPAARAGRRHVERGRALRRRHAPGRPARGRAARGRPGAGGAALPRRPGTDRHVPPPGGRRRKPERRASRHRTRVRRLRHPRRSPICPRPPRFRAGARVPVRPRAPRLLLDLPVCPRRRALGERGIRQRDGQPPPQGAVPRVLPESRGRPLPRRRPLRGTPRRLPAEPGPAHLDGAASTSVLGPRLPPARRCRGPHPSTLGRGHLVRRRVRPHRGRGPAGPPDPGAGARPCLSAARARAGPARLPLDRGLLRDPAADGPAGLPEPSLRRDRLARASSARRDGRCRGSPGRRGAAPPARGALAARPPPGRAPALLGRRGRDGAAPGLAVRRPCRPVRGPRRELLPPARAPLAWLALRVVVRRAHPDLLRARGDDRRRHRPAVRRVRVWAGAPGPARRSGAGRDSTRVVRGLLRELRDGGRADRGLAGAPGRDPRAGDRARRDRRAAVRRLRRPRRSESPAPRRLDLPGRRRVSRRPAPELRGLVRPGARQLPHRGMAPARRRVATRPGAGPSGPRSGSWRTWGCSFTGLYAGWIAGHSGASVVGLAVATIVYLAWRSRPLATIREP